MEEQRYLVFEVRSTGPAEDDFRFSPSTADGPPEAVMRAETLSERDAADARRAPGVVVAESVPMKLIRPVAADDAVGPQDAGSTWGVQAVGALDSPWSGAGIKVAVLDTGIDAGHPAFEGLQVTQCDFSGEGDGDEDGHGTHCAGTIAGRPVDGFRFGVAPGVTELLAGKVLGRDGGTSETIVQGMLWALRSGAHVISMSLGMDFPGLVDRLAGRGFPIQPATSRALEAYRDNLRLFGSVAAFMRANAAVSGQTTILVAATGNDSARAADTPYTIGVAPPAASEGFIPVGALAQSPAGLKVAPFSNTGAVVAAPGVDIVSAKPGGGFASMSGTSMATPHVAGVAALWGESVLAATAALDPGLLSARLQGNSRQVAALTQGDGGAGLVQAPAA